MILQTDF